MHDCWIKKFNEIYVFNTSEIIRISVIFFLWNFFLWDFHKLYFFSVCNFTSLTCLKHSSLCTVQNASWCNFLKILLQNFMHASKNIRKLNVFTDVLKIAHKFNELFMGETISAWIKCHEKIIAFSAPHSWYFFNADHVSL